MARRVRDGARSRALVSALAAFSLFVSVTGAFLLVPGADVGRVHVSEPIHELLGFRDEAATAADNARPTTAPLAKERARASVAHSRGTRLVAKGGGSPLRGGVEASLAVLGAWAAASTDDASPTTAKPTGALVGFEPGSGPPAGGGGTSPLGGGGAGGVASGDDHGGPPDEDRGSGNGNHGRGDKDKDDGEGDEADEAREKAEEAAKEAKEKAEEAAEEAKEKAEEAAEQAEEAAEEAEEE
jgi:hypothetical protein